jgi:hypothetical protein
MSDHPEPVPLKMDLSHAGGRVLPVQDPAGTWGLQISPFVVTLDHLEAQFCFSERRKRLFAGLSDYIRLTRSTRHPPLLQFVSGSFIDDEPDPGDVDVASLIQRVDEESMPLFYDKAFTLGRFGVDPLVFVLGDDPARNCLSVMRLASLYSRRKQDGMQRGFLCLV